MALNFANNNSLSAITSLPASISGGAMTLLQTQTASSSSTIDFTSNIDSTYDEYCFKFINIHPATDNTVFQFQSDTGTNTNYNQTITSSSFYSRHDEDGTDGQVAYDTVEDQAQGTSFQTLAYSIGNGNDECASGYLCIFNPSSTTFVKHFMSHANLYHRSDRSQTSTNAGYFNTSTALTRFRFKMSSGNIDSGVIKLYGIS